MEISLDLPNKRSSLHLHTLDEKSTLLLPDNEKDLRLKIDQVNKEIDEQEMLINKLQSQINTLNVNNQDYNKKRISLSNDSSSKDLKKSLSPLMLLIIIMFGLLFGAYINK
jgi:hypothetical protein